MDAFVDRAVELAELDALNRQHGLVVVFGRRRIGKTKLLGEWLRRRGGLYSQAIEGRSSLRRSLRKLLTIGQPAQMIR